MSEFKWYTLTAYSGSESKVANDINKLALTNEDIREAFIPTRKTIKISRGKKVESDQKVFANYIFVNMIASRATIDKLRSMPKVVGFLGSNPLNPESISDAKIEKMKQESNRDTVAEEEKFEIGDTVKIKEGHFESFTGTVEGKDEAKGLLKIAISIFGRSTMVDISTDNVDKV